MALVFIDNYSVETARANPSLMFIFGDNVKRVGKAGTACLRGEPNSFGIATKRWPSTAPHAFFDDEEGADWLVLLEDLDTLRDAVQAHPDVDWVLPTRGIGNGLSSMKEKCPRLYACLISELEEIFNTWMPWDE